MMQDFGAMARQLMMAPLPVADKSDPLHEQLNNLMGGLEGGKAYGGTANTFYRGGRVGESGNIETGTGAKSPGMWVTPDAKYANFMSTYAPGGFSESGSAVMPLKINGPIKTVKNWKDTAKSAEYARKQGYAAVHFPGLDTPEGSVLILDPALAIPKFGK